MRKFRFIGTEEQAKGYHNSPTTGQIYPEHYLVGSSRSVLSNATFVYFGHEWEEVFETPSASSEPFVGVGADPFVGVSPKMYTLDEVVRAVNNWAHYTVDASSVALFLIDQERASKLAKIKELEEEINKIKETL